jgi:hypothetical protein
MLGHLGLDQSMPKRLQGGDSALLAGFGQPAEAGHVRRKIAASRR